MGMTLTTLSLYGADASAVEPLLAPTDTLRTQNSPWLTIATSIENDPEPGTRYRKLAKQLTKGTEVTALYFFYFDDDLFSCDLYQGGKKSASCDSNSSWSKLGKRLDAMFGDDLASKAFRYAQRCCSLEEQVQLLEETLGTAVFDDTEDVPRVVARGDATLRAVKAREALLRKRPNQYVLTEVPQAEWPECARLREGLYALLKPENDKVSNLTSLLYPGNLRKYLVPGAKNVAAFSYSLERSRQSRLLIYDGATDTHQIWGPYSEPAVQVLWQTRDGALVTLFHNVIQEHRSATSWGIQCGRGEVRCLTPDGGNLWQWSAPELGEHQIIQYTHTSPDGVITLFAGGHNAIVKEDSFLWQLDGETGKLLRSVRIPYSLEVYALVYAASIGAFVYCERSAKSLVLLDDSLRELRRIPYSGHGYFKETQFSGELLWECNDSRTVHLLDLRSGAEEKVRLEISSYPIALLTDGRILAVPEHFNGLFVFNREGTLVARCKLPAPSKLLVEGCPISVSGHIGEVIQDGDTVYVTEAREPESYGFIFDGYYDHLTNHVWRLDPATK